MGVCVFVRPCRHVSKGLGPTGTPSGRHQRQKWSYDRLPSPPLTRVLHGRRQPCLPSVHVCQARSSVHTGCHQVIPRNTVPGAGNISTSGQKVTHPQEVFPVVYSGMFNSWCARVCDPLRPAGGFTCSTLEYFALCDKIILRWSFRQRFAYTPALQVLKIIFKTNSCREKFQFKIYGSDMVEEDMGMAVTLDINLR